MRRGGRSFAGGLGVASSAIPFRRLLAGNRGQCRRISWAVVSTAFPPLTSCRSAATRRDGSAATARDIRRVPASVRGHRRPPHTRRRRRTSAPSHRTCAVHHHHHRYLVASSWRPGLSPAEAGVAAGGRLGLHPARLARRRALRRYLHCLGNLRCSRRLPPRCHLFAPTCARKCSSWCLAVRQPWRPMRSRSPEPWSRWWLGQGRRCPRSRCVITSRRGTTFQRASLAVHAHRPEDFLLVFGLAANMERILATPPLVRAPAHLWYGDTA
uniref:Uncharacterized protein n=1 Tax=Arundo donax TaxID=35708 RepID=A0A0A9DRZ2_ARUDO